MVARRSFFFLLLSCSCAALPSCAMVYGLDELKDRVGGAEGGGPDGANPDRGDASSSGDGAQNTGKDATDTDAAQGNDGGTTNDSGGNDGGGSDAGGIDASALDTDPALVGFWRFEEGTGTTVKDSSNFHNDGTFSGTQGWTTGHAGGGMSFNGSSWVRVPNSPSLYMGSTFTISAWAKPTSYTTDPRIVSKADDWELKLNVLSAEGFPQIDVAKAGGGSAYFQSDQYGLMPSQWHHVAFTFDHGTAMFYFDGVNRTITTQGTVTSVLNGPRDFYLGAYDETVNYLTGVLDEVRLYNRVLTANEITIIAQ